MSGCQSPEENKGNTHHCDGCGVVINDCTCICNNFRKLYEMFSDLSIKSDQQWDLMYKTQDSLSKRMSKLEEAYQADAMVAKDIIFDGARRNEELRQVKSDCDSHCGAISVLEDKMKQSTEWMMDKQEKLKFLDDGIDQVKDELSKEIGLLEARFRELERFQDVTHAQHRLFINKKSPHKCPMCDDGIRLQPGSGGLGLTNCKTCEGKGIVWG